MRFVLGICAALLVASCGASQASPVAADPSTATGSSATQSPASSPAASVGLWDLSQRKDELTGDVSQMAMLTATSGESSLGKPIRAVARCKNGTTDFYILWGDYLGNDDRVSVQTKVDDGAIEDASWGNSTTNDTTFFPDGGTIGKPVDFLKGMFGHDKLVTRTTPYSATVLTAVFTITGVENAVSDLRKACGW